MRALVIGAGGLGTPLLLSLLARGVRQIGIYEPDRVELSNLHRQILYREQDVGRKKIEVLAEVLAQRAPDVELTLYDRAFDRRAAAELDGYDVIFDGCDHFEVKLEISDACVDRNRPYVFAGVLGSDGQVLAVLPGRSACLRCLFDEAPPPGAAPTCAEVGILGPIAGLIGARQAALGMALAAGDASVTNQLHVYDGRLDRSRIVPLQKAADCRGCGSRKAERGQLAPEAPANPLDPAPLADLSGLSCPHTYIEARRRLEALPEGGRLWVLLEGDEAKRGLPKSLIAAGHKVLASRVEGRHHRVLLERSRGDS